MGWVVSSWRTERLAALLDAQAHEAAREIVRAAERDARRLERASAREVADAVAYLEVLERLGEEVLLAVRVQRRALKAGGEAPADRVVPAHDESRDPADGEIRVRRRTNRASLRESPLAELFRSTTVTG